MPVSLNEITDARAFLRDFFEPTPLVRAESLSRITGADVFLKLESVLPTGSFKVRGALWALSRAVRQGDVVEVVASSTGNHGAAVAWAAARLGVAATIFLPEDANPVKRATIDRLGAKIVTGGSRDVTDAFQLARHYAGKEGVYFLNDATDSVLPAGPATIGSEIVEQLPVVGEVYVPVGDSALIRGIAGALAHFNSSARVTGVQAEGAPAYYLSWRAGEVITTERCETIADGLATRTPDAGNVSELRRLVDRMCLVSEKQLEAAIRLLQAEEGVIAEPAAAATLAAMLNQAPPRAQPIVLLITGSNIGDARLLLR